MPKLLVALTVSLVAFLAGFFAITELLLPSFVGFGEEVAVPLVVGESREAALRSLKAAQLVPEVRLERTDPEIPAGTILAQNPRPGSMVKLGRRVSLTVSTGAAAAIVPPLRGKTERQTRLDLAASGLEPGDILRIRDDAVGPGRVLATAPAAGTSVVKGTPVDLLLNEGPVEAAFVMPDLRGHRYDDVQRRLESKGFRVERARYVGGGLGVERVTAQDPAPGARIVSGARVSLSVGGG